MTPRAARSRLALACIAAALAFPAASPGQVLTPQQIERVRRGPAEIHLAESPTAVGLDRGETVPVVVARVNGRGPFRLVVDLASPITRLAPAVVDRAGLDRVVERDRGDVVRADSISVAGAGFTDLLALVESLPDSDGRLGLSFFRDLSLQIDYPRDRLVLARGALPEPGAGTSVPFRVERGVPRVRLQSSGEAGAWLALSTGSPEWIVLPRGTLEALPTAGDPVEGVRLYDAGGAGRPVLVGRLATDLHIGGTSLPRPRVLLAPYGRGGWVGSGLLRQFRVTIDRSRGRLTLAAAEPGPLRVPPFPSLGFSASRVDGGWVVAGVVPGTPAADRRLAVGDRILAVGGRPAASLSGAAWRRLAAAGDTVAVTIRKDGLQLTLDLPVVGLPRDR